jgi:uncharacterized protein YggL (DUF469 family)
MSEPIPVVEFLVDDVGEEYHIVRKMLCPKCRGKLKVNTQELMLGVLSDEKRNRIGASEKTDRLHIECQNCGFEFPVYFHLSSKYQETIDKLIDEFEKTLDERVRESKDGVEKYGE